VKGDAATVLSRGLTDRGARHVEETPVETALPTDTAVVAGQRVVETGTPASTTGAVASSVGPIPLEASLDLEYP